MEYTCRCADGFGGDDCEDNSNSATDDQVSHDTADDIWCDFTTKIDDCVLKMMDFVLKMVDFVLKMTLATRARTTSSSRARRRAIIGWSAAWCSALTAAAYRIWRCAPAATGGRRMMRHVAILMSHVEPPRCSSSRRTRLVLMCNAAASRGRG